MQKRNVQVVQRTQSIALAQPDLSGNEAQYVTRAIQSSWISSTGEFVDRFEAEFAEMTGAKTALTVVNGTAALHLALAALEIAPGDEVIVPSLTFIATANAVRYCGATPVFVDIDPKTWCLDPQKVATAVTARTKAIIVVHLYGHPADMDAINEIAKAKRLRVIEDAAEAILARYKGKPTGGLADVATYSFYGNKVFTCGEGGALTTNFPELAARARLLRGQGMDPQRRYFFPVIGYNYRLTNVASAILCAQLERREEILACRRRICTRYAEALSSIPGLGFQPVADWAELSPWLFSICVDSKAFGISRDALMNRLAESKIETRPFFIPLHLLPPYKGTLRSLLPHTERLGAVGMNLPTHLNLTDDDIGFIADRISQNSR